MLPQPSANITATQLNSLAATPLNSAEIKGDMNGHCAREGR